MKRVLITGSRGWNDYGAIWSVLKEYDEIGLVVVHGDCPTGADAHAATWVTLSAGRASEEAHPADWERDCDSSCYHKPRLKNGRHYCPMAGHIRNQKMVDLGADICLAFPMPDSRGTVDCMRRARKAGIPVREFAPDR